MSIKFIPGDDISFVATDADTLTELEVSGIFVGQDKRKNFRLGNTGPSSTNFDITASGLNSSVIDDVEFSTDNGISFATTATINDVDPNEITDNVIVRYISKEGDVVGVGSFLIRVDES